MRSSGTLAGGVANGLSLREGDVSGKGDHKPGVKGAAGVVPFAGKAVQDAAEAGGFPLLFEQVESVVPGVGAVVGWAAVDDDGLLVGGGDLHLAAEDLLLGFARGVVVEVVEADLAAGDDFGFG